jgi:hypothetical protein
MIDEPTRRDLADHAALVRARRRAIVRKKVSELLGAVRRLTESVQRLADEAMQARKAAGDLSDRIETLETTSCKFARTVGAACPSLGERCEICEREAEAEWFKAKALGAEEQKKHDAKCKCGFDYFECIG